MITKVKVHAPDFTLCYSWVSLMFSAGRQIAFTGTQNIFELNFIMTQKTFPLDGQTRQVESSSHLVNLPGVWPVMKPLATSTAVAQPCPVLTVT